MNMELLRELGLTEYEAKAYACLVAARRPVAGREVASRSGVPPSRVYDALRSLEKRKLAILVRSSPITFEAIDPEQGLEEYAAERSRGIRELTSKAIEDIKSTPEEPAETSNEFIKVIFGNEARFTQSVPLYKTAKKRIWVISVSDRIPNYLIREIANAKARGVDHRVITTQLKKKNRAVMQSYMKIGTKPRYCPSIRGFNQIVVDDDNTLQVFFNPDKGGEVCVVVIRNPGYNKTAADFFQSIWEKAVPVRH